MAIKDYTGKVVGRLTVVERVLKEGRAYYNCKCTCGRYKLVRGDSIHSGTTLSCGCLIAETVKKEHTRHGDAGGSVRLYNIYRNMKARCYNPKQTFYDNYGGKGVQVCTEWLDSYDSFREWALSNGYSDNLSIDREDVNGNYTPENCRWVKRAVQANNTTRNVLIEYRGQSKTLAQWCEELDYPYASTQKMVKKGNKSIEEIFTRKHVGKGYQGT